MVMVRSRGSLRSTNDKRQLINIKIHSSDTHEISFIRRLRAKVRSVFATVQISCYFEVIAYIGERCRV